MHKKFLMACMAIAAFAAFVIAPAASASPVLTSNGVPVPVGTSITGTTTGEAIFTGPEIHCHGHLTGIVTANTGTTIAGEVPVGSAHFTGTGPGGDCTSNLGNIAVTVNSKLCLHASNASDNVTVTGCGANVTFTLVATGIATCKYSTASVTGTYTTNAPATVNVVEQPANKEEGGIFCPSSGKLDMDFDLYTTDGTVLTIS